jgi:hypothetical protein
MKRLAFLLVTVALALEAQAAMPVPKSMWEFNRPDPNAATIGVPLQLVGSAEVVAGINAAAGAIQIGQGSYYVCTHGIAPNGGGTKVNEWTLLIDFSYPPSSRSDPPSGYNDLFQTNPTNVDDSDWTINSSGAIGIGAVGYTSAQGYTTVGDTWYRMVVVVDNGTRHDVYIDGVEILKGTQQGVDGRFSLASTLLLFCAGNSQDGDDAPINVSTVAMWDTPLSAEEVAALGGAGDKLFIETRASHPAPADGLADVAVTTDLAWVSGEYAAGHNVYLSLSREDVAAGAATALIAEGLAGEIESLEIEPLDFGQTYYWRVDEVNATPGSMIFEGNVWTFTTEPYAYPIQNVTATASGEESTSPASRTIDGSGLTDGRHSISPDDMWVVKTVPAWIQYAFDKEYVLHELLVWNANPQFETWMGFGAKDVTVEYSTDGETWTTLENVPPFAQGTGQPTYEANTTVSFGAITAKYVKLTINTVYAASPIGTSLSEVRFSYIPVRAFAPDPADGATQVALDAELSWRPGREATSHVVCFGTDAAAVAEGTAPAETVTGNSYTPGPLGFGTTYYWKVDEVGDVGTREGDLWSFTSQEYELLEDFESYNDTDNYIYDTWIDGYLDHSSGSQVGYLDSSKGTFGETTIIHGGRQSMPMLYDNTSSPYYSEATRSLASALDLSADGADSLSVYYRGIAPSFAESSDGEILMNGLGADIWSTADAFRFAFKNLSGNGSIVARVNSLYGSNGWAKAGVMIRQDTTAGAANAMMAKTFLSGNGAAFQWRPTAAGTSSNATAAAAVASPYWIKLERTGNSFSAYLSPDGAAWTRLGTAQTVTMTDPVLIGLALTSHDASIQTHASFSNITTTGNVTGSWQVVDIGVTQPTGNSAEPIYLTVKDNSRTVTLLNPDTVATARFDWQQWLIPLSDITSAGVKATAIKSITLGVGNRTSPTAGRTGTVYFDDLARGKPAQ